MSTAIVFGATGYTGRAVVPALRKQGFDVVAHVRPSSSRRDALTQEFEAVGATVAAVEWDSTAIRALVASTQPTLAFGLLGITRASAKREAKRTRGDTPTYEEVDFGLTAMAIDACSAEAPNVRFVYLSSIGTSASASGAYLQARWKTEQHLRNSGLDFTIARPSFITGDRDESRPAEAVGAAIVGAGLSIARALGAKKLAKRYDARTNDELAAALVSAATNPSARNQTLESEDL